MLGHSAALLVALAMMAFAQSKDVDSIRYENLAVGQQFEIRTSDCVFQGELLDRATGKCQMRASRAGEPFSEPRTVYLLGATAGRQGPQMLVLMHEVKVGLKMELGYDDLEQKNRHVTSEVAAIRLVR